jgi:hypothetical protein
MADEEPISFAGNVRVRVTRVTEAAGVAGLLGQVHGVTNPSATGVEVIGDTKDDTAPNVFFAEQNESHWFAPELLEFVDHAPGTEIRVANSPTRSVRKEDGEWQDPPSLGCWAVTHLVGTLRLGRQNGSRWVAASDAHEIVVGILCPPRSLTNRPAQRMNVTCSALVDRSIVATS